MKWYLLLFIFTCCFGYEQKPIVVVVPSYNNEQWYRKNLDSILSQHYDNYRVIYINDCSKDNTGALVDAHLATRDHKRRVQVIHNEVNRGALYNIYHAVHACEDHEIIVTLDGDDWFKDRFVLQKVNRAYQDPNVWLTYGQFESYPSGKIGFCKSLSRRIIEQEAYRAADWVTSHLRTFYAKLFKQIKLKDFIHDGELFCVTWDMAFMFPMLEMAKGRVKCIQDVLYVYNEANPINDYKTKLLRQLQYDKYIRSMPKYAPLDNLWKSQESSEQIDAIVFCEHPERIDDILSMIEQTDMPVASVTVVHEQELSLDLLGAHRPDVAFFVLEEEELSDLFERLCSTKGYLLLLSDVIEQIDALPLADAVALLQRSKALSMHFALDAHCLYSPLYKRALHVPSLVALQDDYFAWQYKDAEGAWRHPFDLWCSLSDKEQLQKVLDDARFTSCQELRQIVHEACIDLAQIGLCARTRAVEHPMAVACCDTAVRLPGLFAALNNAGYATVRRNGMLCLQK